MKFSATLVNTLAVLLFLNFLFVANTSALGVPGVNEETSAGINLGVGGGITAIGELGHHGPLMVKEWKDMIDNFVKGRIPTTGTFDKVKIDALKENADKWAKNLGRFMVALDLIEAGAKGDKLSAAWTIMQQVVAELGPTGVRGGAIGLVLGMVKTTIDSELQARAAERGVNLEIFLYTLQRDSKLKEQGYASLRTDASAVKYILETYVAQNYKGGRAMLHSYVTEVLRKPWPNVFRDPGIWEYYALGTRGVIYEGDEELPNLEGYIISMLNEINKVYKVHVQRKKLIDAAKKAKLLPFKICFNPFTAGVG